MQPWGAGTPEFGTFPPVGSATRNVRLRRNRTFLDPLESFLLGPGWAQSRLGADAREAAGRSATPDRRSNSQRCSTWRPDRKLRAIATIGQSFRCPPDNSLRLSVHPGDKDASGFCTVLHWSSCCPWHGTGISGRQKSRLANSLALIY